MSDGFTACPGCARHVKVGEPRCPFCGKELATEPAAAEAVPEKKLSPAAKVGLGVTAVAVAGVAAVVVFGDELRRMFGTSIQTLYGGVPTANTGARRSPPKCGPAGCGAHAPVQTFGGPADAGAEDAGADSTEQKARER
jgi:hypothetical protein